LGYISFLLNRSSHYLSKSMFILWTVHFTSLHWISFGELDSWHMCFAMNGSFQRLSRLCDEWDVLVQCVYVNGVDEAFRKREILVSFMRKTIFYLFQPLFCFVCFVFAVRTSVCLQLWCMCCWRVTLGDERRNSNNLCSISEQFSIFTIIWFV